MRISDWSSDVCSSDLAEQCAGRPHPARALVRKQRDARFGEHLRSRAIARIAVALNARTHARAIGIFADEQDVVKALLALFLARPFAGLERRFSKGIRLRHRFRSEEHTSELQSL